MADVACQIGFDRLQFLAPLSLFFLSFGFFIVLSVYFQFSVVVAERDRTSGVFVVYFATGLYKKNSVIYAPRLHYC